MLVRRLARVGGAVAATETNAGGHHAPWMDGVMIGICRRWHKWRNAFNATLDKANLLALTDMLPD
jgi:hypothetical protein